MLLVTKAPPNNSINSKWHTKKLKSSRTCLIGYSDFISHEWLLIARGWTHTQIDIHAHRLHRQKQFQETRSVPDKIIIPYV